MEVGFRFVTSICFAFLKFSSGAISSNRQSSGRSSYLAKCRNILNSFVFNLLTQIDASLTNTKVIPVGVGAVADGGEAFKSKLKFQIQHEVFR